MTALPLFKWEPAACNPKARICDVPGVGQLLVAPVRRTGRFDGFLNGERAVARTTSIMKTQRKLEELSWRYLLCNLTPEKVR
jgi:hypothetical protein